MFHTMHRIIMFFVVCAGVFISSCHTTPRVLAPMEDNKFDTAQVERITGLKGVWNESEGVFKISVPRTDVIITVDQWKMPPFMGLTSWVAFQRGAQAQSLVMGDLVLFRDEVNPVMSVLLESGLNVTALHNHFFYDEPKVYFMHIGGEGDTESLAAGVRKALDTVKSIRAATPIPPLSFGGQQISAGSINPLLLEGILGTKVAQRKEGMVKFVLGRKTKMACGCEVGGEMGINTWAAFAGTDKFAVVDGDFVVLETELQPVLKALRTGGIDIVAIHHHLVMEEPRVIFLHFWGKGEATRLAQTVRTALDCTATDLKSDKK